MLIQVHDSGVKRPLTGAVLRGTISMQKYMRANDPNLVGLLTVIVERVFRKPAMW